MALRDIFEAQNGHSLVAGAAAVSAFFDWRTSRFIKRMIMKSTKAIMMKLMIVFMNAPYAMTAAPAALASAREA